VSSAESGAQTNAAPQLYSTDGSIRLPGVSMQTRDTGIADMRHFQNQPCRGTRFSHTFSRGQDETLGAEVARKYLSWVGLYNPQKEQEYRERREWHDQACAQ